MEIELDKPSLCVCKAPIERLCVNCGRGICEDSSCGTDTVDGFLCGSYTEWGCARKYTTCDSCLDDKAIAEDDLNMCPECGVSECDACAEQHTCSSELDGSGDDECAEDSGIGVNSPEE